MSCTLHRLYAYHSRLQSCMHRLQTALASPQAVVHACMFASSTQTQILVYGMPGESVTPLKRPAAAVPAAVPQIFSVSAHAKSLCVCVCMHKSGEATVAETEVAEAEVYAEGTHASTIIMV